jgi:peptide deformylase
MILQILTYPDSGLRIRATRVDTITDRIEKIAWDMISTMEQADGIGLAAVQVGIPYRIVTMRMPDGDPHILINPKIYSYSKAKVSRTEACLSVPGAAAPVSRPQQIWATYQDLTGKEHDIALENIEAACLQHEIDHLDGKLFIDRISYLRRTRMYKHPSQIF